MCVQENFHKCYKRSLGVCVPLRQSKKKPTCGREDAADRVRGLCFCAVPTHPKAPQLLSWEEALQPGCVCQQAQPHRCCAGCRGCAARPGWESTRSASDVRTGDLFCMQQPLLCLWSPSRLSSLGFFKEGERISPTLCRKELIIPY